MASYNQILYTITSFAVLIGGYIGYNWYTSDQYRSESSTMFNQFLHGNQAYLPNLTKRTDSYGQISRFIMLMRHINGETKLDKAELEQIQDERQLFRSMKHVINIVHILNNGVEMDLGCLHKRNSHWPALADYASFISTKAPLKDSDLQHLGSRAMMISGSKYSIDEVINQKKCLFKKK